MDIKEFTSYSNEGSTCQDNGISFRKVEKLNKKGFDYEKSN